MSIFPELIPSSRVFTPGEYPHTPFAGWSRQQSRVRHSNVMLNSTLRARFDGLSAEQIESAIDHYNGRFGTYLPFEIPAAILRGVDDDADFTLTGYFWRYASEPVVEDLPYGAYNLEIELVSVTPESGLVASSRWRANITWSPGTAAGLASGGATAAGANWSVIAAWEEVASDGLADGLAVGPLVTWTPGTASESLDEFSAVLYSGTAATQSITGVDFEPGFVWIKERNGSNDHYIFDYARGTTKYRRINALAEVTNVNTLTSFDSDGFSIGNSTLINATTKDYVSFCIKKGAAGAANNSGTISSTVYVNAAANFSIFTYTGNGTSGATVGHGLGAAPEFVFIARLDTAASIPAGSQLVGNQHYALFDSNSIWGTTFSYYQNFSSTTVTISGGTAVNANTGTFVGYAFRSMPGTSKIGTYSGAGAVDSTITCDFPPQFVMIRATNASGSWLIFDDARGVTKQLVTDSANPETTVDKVAFTSTGFTAKANQNTNTSGVDYLYMAFR